MKIVAFDLDNTLLDSNKDISEVNLNSLLRAKSMGVEVVVSTGRILAGVPDILTDICRYFITINGARVYDGKTGEDIYLAPIPWETAVRVYDYGDTLPCIYDAYIGDNAYMGEVMREKLIDFMMDKHYAVEMTALRQPVPDLKRFVADNHLDILKQQYFFKDLTVMDEQLKILPGLFPELKFSGSLVSNIEINSAKAGKGIGLEKLCEHIGCTLDDAVAFGDGRNDVELLEYAGLSFCMINGDEDVKPFADRITEFDCNHSGMGIELNRLLDKM